MDPADRTLTKRPQGDGPGTTLPWRLTVVASPAAELIDRSITLPKRLGLGRAPIDGVQLVVPDPLLSRHHATFRVAVGGALVVEDAGSKNGTLVQGARVEQAELAEQDLVRVGDTLLVVERERGAPPIPAVPGAPIGGRSEALREAFFLLERAASTEIPVLIRGETGTGKELASRFVHARSGRRGELVAVNCAAIPEKLMEASLFGHRKGAFTGAAADAPGMLVTAEKGTLFLDEIGDLAPELQPKLLRVLEQREFTPVGETRPRRCDVRFLAATHVDLGQVSGDGGFRRDLFARLGGYAVELPPLRARRVDILPLATRFLAELVTESVVPRLSADAAEWLLGYPWPLNVRELRAMMQRVALVHGSATTLEPSHLASAAVVASGARAAGPSAPEEAARPRLKRPSREALEGLMARHQGNILQVAQALGRQRVQVYRWLKSYGLAADDYRDEDG